MSYTPPGNPGPEYLPPPMPPVPPKKRHRLRNAVLILGALTGAIIVIAATASVVGGGNGAGKPNATLHTHTSAPAPEISTPPVEHPDAKGTGSCNYTLGSDPVGGTAVATGDIEVRNTGNVGVQAILTITWPQQGYAPLKKAKIVKLGIGASRDVQFHRSLTSNELDNLQNWQLGHIGEDGCTYKISLLSTFGQAQARSAHLLSARRVSCPSSAACDWTKASHTGGMVSYPTGSGSALINQGVVFRFHDALGHWPKSATNHTGGFLWLRHGRQGSFLCIRSGHWLNTFARYDRAKWTKAQRHSCSSAVPPAGNWSL